MSDRCAVPLKLIQYGMSAVTDRYCEGRNPGWGEHSDDTKRFRHQYHIMTMEDLHLYLNRRAVLFGFPKLNLKGIKSREAGQPSRKHIQSVMCIGKFGQQSRGQRTSSGASRGTRDARSLLNLKTRLSTEDKRGGWPYNGGGGGRNSWLSGERL